MASLKSAKQWLSCCYHHVVSTPQLPDEYLSTMVSVLFQTHLLKDGSLFPDLAPVLAEATPADIHTLPSLQDNLSVYVAESHKVVSHD